MGKYQITDNGQASLRHPAQNFAPTHLIKRWRKDVS